MAEEQSGPDNKTSAAEVKIQKPLRHSPPANSVSVNAGSHSARPDPNTSMNNVEGHHWQDHDQSVHDSHLEEEERHRSEEQHTQLQRWVHETCDTELTPAERFEKHKWEKGCNRSEQE